jgi:hypothetical protein
MFEVDVTIIWRAVVGEGRPRADGAPRVSISRDGIGVGHGWWGGQRIEDCDADLGDDVYEALDAAIGAAS